MVQIWSADRRSEIAILDAYLYLTAFETPSVAMKDGRHVSMITLRGRGM